MTTPEKAEPERSAISSTDCRHCLTHPLPGPHMDGKCCLCGITREVLDEPEPRCTCGCPKGAHMGKPRGCIPHGFHEYEASEEHDFSSPSHCAACMRTWMGRGVAAMENEPPLTPEEEEEASEDACTCGAAGDAFVPLGHYKDCPCAPEAPEDEEGLSGPCDCGEGAVHYTAADCPAEERRRAACQDCLAGVHGPNAHREPPPQPDRRPPYLLAYSVQGHLYEVALPGDATVAALDGRLVITHQLGPVAGICQIAPITSEESA
jgi:hypothetical protein